LVPHLEKESAERIIIAMLRFIILHKKIPNIWKMVKTILIDKAGDISDPGNWRPIILTSVIYRIIFGRIAQVMISLEMYQSDQIYYQFHKNALFLESMDAMNT
jgi:hypothetical protein